MQAQPLMPPQTLPNTLFASRCMRRPVPNVLEWQLCEDDDEYRAALQRTRPATVAARPHPRLPTYAALGVCLVVGWLLGLQLWHTAHVGLAQIQQELELAVEADLWRTAHGVTGYTVTIHAPATQNAWQRQTRREATLLQAAQSGEELTATTTLLEMGERWALVQLTTHAAPGQPALRQTRVYVESDWGWGRVPPRAAQWGRPQRLESRYFIFHYYARDAAAVAQAAVLLDARYPTLYAAFFPEPPGGRKWVVEVTPEQQPGVLDAAALDAPLVTASPGVYLAPDSISDVELLAQALVLSLLNRLHLQARERYAVHFYWLPVLDGVRLWQVWASDLPLAAWREPLVRLIYPVSPGPEPTAGSEFCRQHWLWMAAPAEINLPLTCHSQVHALTLGSWGEVAVPPFDSSVPFYVDPTSALKRLLRDRDLLIDSTGKSKTILYPGTVIAVATALEYAAATYGPQTIPALVAALAAYGGKPLPPGSEANATPQDRQAKHFDWTIVCPAVFGVSVEEFDAGWRAYLVEHYGVEEP